MNELEFQEEWLSAYLDDELTAEQRQVVEQRLAIDPAAQSMLDDLRRVRSMVSKLPSWSGSSLKFAIPDELPGSDKNELDEALDSSNQSQSLPINSVRTSSNASNRYENSNGSLVTWLVTAASLLLMLGIGYFFWPREGLLLTQADRGVGTAAYDRLEQSAASDAKIASEPAGGAGEVASPDAFSLPPMMKTETSQEHYGQAPDIGILSLPTAANAFSERDAVAAKSLEQSSQKPPSDPTALRASGAPSSVPNELTSSLQQNLESGSTAGIEANMLPGAAFDPSSNLPASDLPASNVAGSNDLAMNDKASSRYSTESLNRKQELDQAAGRGGEAAMAELPPPAPANALGREIAPSAASADSPSLNQPLRFARSDAWADSQSLEQATAQTSMFFSLNSPTANTNEATAEVLMATIETAPDAVVPLFDSVILSNQLMPIENSASSFAMQSTAEKEASLVPKIDAPGANAAEARWHFFDSTKLKQDVPSVSSLVLFVSRDEAQRILDELKRQGKIDSPVWQIVQRSDAGSAGENGRASAGLGSSNTTPAKPAASPANNDRVILMLNSPAK